MVDYSYSVTINKLRELLVKMQGEVRMPDKATQEWLASIGFTSSNDRLNLGVLKQIGFIEANGRPTELWRDYRGINNKQVLARGIKQGYSELYQLFDNAHDKSDLELKPFFTQKMNVGERAITAIISTYKALCSMADFTSSSPTITSTLTVNPSISGKDIVARDGGIPIESPIISSGIPSFNKTTHSGIPVTINIQLTLPETNDPKVYESFFKAMKDCFLV